MHKQESCVLAAILSKPDTIPGPSAPTPTALKKISSGCHIPSCSTRASLAYRGAVKPKATNRPQDLQADGTVVDCCLRWTNGSIGRPLSSQAWFHHPNSAVVRRSRTMRWTLRQTDSHNLTQSESTRFLHVDDRFPCAWPTHCCLSSCRVETIEHRGWRRSGLRQRRHLYKERDIFSLEVFTDLTIYCFHQSRVLSCANIAGTDACELATFAPPLPSRFNDELCFLFDDAIMLQLATQSSQFEYTYMYIASFRVVRCLSTP